MRWQPGACTSDRYGVQRNVPGRLCMVVWVKLGGFNLASGWRFFHPPVLFGAPLYFLFPCFPTLSASPPSQVNLSFCSSITDAGLSALARMPCLHKLNLVHCSSLTMPGLQAALAAAAGLRKVKLLLSWGPRLEPSLVAALEQRGCRFRWMEKPALAARLEQREAERAD